MNIGLALAGLAAITAAAHPRLMGVEPWHKWVRWYDAPVGERRYFSSHRRLSKNEIGQAWSRIVRANMYGPPADCHEAIDFIAKHSVNYGVFLALADANEDPAWRADSMRNQVSDAVRNYIRHTKTICSQAR